MYKEKEEKTKKVKKRTFQELIDECMTEDGAIDLAKMEELEGSCGCNGGKGCDVTEGPCSYGGWN